MLPVQELVFCVENQDIKYNKETADFASLQEIQLEILGSVCQTLGKGGIITYSTCTMSQRKIFKSLRRF